MKKFLIRGAVVLAAVYLFLCGLIYFVPQHLFYAPSSEPSDIEQARSANYPVERVDYRSADGTPLFAWYTKPANKNSKIVVFMHGNAYKIAGFYHKVQPFARRGWGTFLPEYRGFGGLPGEINQQNLEADAVAAVEYLHKLGYQNRDIVIYGMSLGSHMALNTAVYFKGNNAVCHFVIGRRLKTPDIQRFKIRNVFDGQPLFSILITVGRRIFLLESINPLLHQRD